MPNLPFKTAGWDTHSEVRLREIEYPLDQDPAHFTVSRMYEGPATTYAALALDTADTEFSSAFFVKQGKMTDIGGGAVRYERLFATVPATSDILEEYVFEYPAYIVAGFLSSASKTITAIVWNGIGHTFTTSTAHGWTTGTLITLQIAYDFGTGTHIKLTQTFAALITVLSTTTFSISSGMGVTGPGTISNVSGTANATAAGRLAPKSIIAAGRTQCDFALTSAGALNTDLPLRQVFAPIDNTGNETLLLNVTTFPSAANYGASVQSGSEIIASCTRLRYLGNIYVRKTRYVPAL